MNRKKLLTLFAGVLPIAGLLAGCTSPTNPATTAPTTSAPATSSSPTPTQLPPVTLKLIAVGDASPGNGSQMVIDAVNAYIKPLINTTITVEYLPWADWTTKYSLVFSSGEDFDGIYTANWSFYQSTATKNGFMELTPDMLNTYAPDVMKELPTAAWEQAKIGGKIFMVPTTFNEFSSAQYVVRDDLRTKYNVPAITDLDSFGKYLQAIKDNEPTMVPFDLSPANDFSNLQMIFNQQYNWAPVGGNPFQNFVYDYTDAGVKVLDTYQTPEFAAFVQKMYEWRQAGYWSQNAMSNDTRSADSFDAGKSGATIANMLSAVNYSAGWKDTHPDWAVQVYDGTAGKPVIGTAYIGSGIGIHATSKNAERLLQFINLARTDKFLNQLLCYGIEGKQWQATDGKVTYLRSDTNTAYTDGLSWFFRNATYQLQPAGAYTNYDPLFASMTSRQVSHILQGFNFDDSAIKDQIAAFTDVQSQYLIPLIAGMVDPATGIATLNEKAKAAGADKILAALTEQATAYMQANKG